MALICITGWAYFNYLESKAVQQQATDQAANVSRVLEEHVYRSLDPIDLVFKDIGRHVVNGGLDSVAESEREWRRLKATAETLPQVSSFVMLDADGEFRLFSRQFPAPAGNFNFREYFQAHESGKAGYLGELVAAGTSGKPIFTYSHRLEDAAGEFAGVILASMEISYFQSFYRSLDLGPGSAVGLFRRDGKLMMREPLLPNIAGQHLDKHPIYTTLIPQSPTGTFTGYSPYDGEQKLAYYLASDDLPFVINTVLGMDSVIMPFEQRFLQSTAILLLVFSLLMTTMLTQLRVIERTYLAHQRVRQSQRFVQSVLDSVSAAIAILSPAGEIVSVNAAWRRFGRLGGEEFVAILPHAEAEGAVVQAERLRQAAQDTQVMCSEGPIVFTISIGVATLQPGMDFTDLLKEADEALYRAKANGRNQVVSAPST